LVVHILIVWLVILLCGILVLNSIHLFYLLTLYDLLVHTVLAAKLLHDLVIQILNWHHLSIDVFHELVTGSIVQLLLVHAITTLVGTVVRLDAHSINTNAVHALKILLCVWYGGSISCKSVKVGYTHVWNSFDLIQLWLLYVLSQSRKCFPNLLYNVGLCDDLVLLTLLH
jgi:hypothetical protein